MTTMAEPEQQKRKNHTRLRKYRPLNPVYLECPKCHVVGRKQVRENRNRNTGELTSTVLQFVHMEPEMITTKSGGKVHKRRTCTVSKLTTTEEAMKEMGATDPIFDNPAYYIVKDLREYIVELHTRSQRPRPSTIINRLNKIIDTYASSIKEPE